MNFQAYIVTILLALPVSVFAQQHDYRSEQILLTTDNSSYTLSDTINVRGMVTCLARDTSLPYSHYVYLELIDPKADSVVVRQKLPCHDRGLFSSQIALEPDLNKGIYYLRAYTNLMRNFSDDSFAFQPVAIGTSIPSDDKIINEDISIHTFTAGETLTPNVAQQLHAVITNHLGYPVKNQELILLNQTDDTLAVERSSASGYVTFNFIPKTNDIYNLLFSAMGVEKSVNVPSVSNKQPKIQSVIRDRRLTFTIHGHMPENSRVFFFDRINGLSEIDGSSGGGTLNLPVKPLSPVTLFITDDSLRVITEYSVMPRNHTSISVEVSDTLLPGERIALLINGHNPDSLRALTHFDFEPVISNSNALTSLVLQSDFSSAVPLPIIKNSDSSNAEFQAWLESAKFSRFCLADVLHNGSTIYNYQPEAYLTINGTVYDDINGMHRMKGGQVVAYNGVDNSIYDTEIDQSGHFCIPVSDFIQGTEFFLQPSNSKGHIKKYITNLDDESYPGAMVPYQLHKTSKKYSDAEASIGKDKDDRHTLPDVIVKARVVNTEKENDKKYYGIRYKDRELIEKHNYRTVLDILRSMPTIKIRQAEKLSDGSIASFDRPSGNKDAYQLIYVPFDTRGHSSFGENMVPILVDGVQHDFISDNSIFEYPADDIESIEILSPSETLIYMVKTLTQVISIKTRKLGPKTPKDAKGTRSWPSGLSPFATEFSNDIKAPDKPGNYNLIIDIVTDDGRVKTITHPITVINPGE